MSIDQRIANANPMPYEQADEDDMVASFTAHIIGGKYSSGGEFILTLSIPADILNPHDLMKSMGFMTYWEGRKV